MQYSLCGFALLIISSLRASSCPSQLLGELAAQREGRSIYEMGLSMSGLDHCTLS